MYPLETKYYSAGLRAKAGEFLACRDLDDLSKERLLPYFILPPFMELENNAPSIKAAIDLQINVISAHWGSRPCLVDMRFLKFSSDGGVDASWISQLLDGARLLKCCFIPVIDLDTNFYRTSAVGAHAKIAESGAALRITCATSAILN